MTNETTGDAVTEALSVYRAHKDEPHPAVGALRALLLEHLREAGARADMLVAIGFLKGEAGEDIRLAALRALGVPSETLERMLAETARSTTPR